MNRKDAHNDDTHPYSTDGNGRSRWVRHPDLNGEVRAKRRTKNRFLIAKTTW